MADKDYNIKIEPTSRGDAVKITGPENVAGIIYNEKKLVGPEKLKQVVEQRDNLEQKLGFTNELLEMHRFFDDLRDSIKREEKNVDDAIVNALTYLGENINCAYVCFQPNTNLIETAYKGTEIVHTQKGFKKLNDRGFQFFNSIRAHNPDLRIDFQSPKNVFYEDLEKIVEQVSDKDKIAGSGFTIYLKPGNEYIGAVQALQTRKIGNREGKFIQEWVRVADTFLSDVLNIKIIGRSSEDDSVANIFGLTTEQLTSDFTGAGDINERGKTKEITKEEKRKWMFYNEKSYFDTNYVIVRDRLTAFFNGFRSVMPDEENSSGEEMARKKFEKGIRLVKEIYKEEPEFGISREDAEKDLNSAISLGKLVSGLFENEKYKNIITKDFKLPNETPVDADTIENAAVFTAMFARAVKYMHQADYIQKVEDVRERNDIREMTSYLSDLIQLPLVRNNYVFDGTPLVDRKGVPSLLGQTIIYISEMVDPNKKGQFAVDLIERAIEYEERVQETTTSKAQPIEQALKEMYDSCVIKGKESKLEFDVNGINAIKMIDHLVNPKELTYFPKFRQTYGI